MRTSICLTLAAVLAAPTTVLADPAWRDLNHNGRLDPYEDARQPMEARIDDLLGQMTVEDKAGAMMHGSLPAGDSLGHGGETYDLKAVGEMIDQGRLNSFITRLVVPPAQLAEQNNAIQKLAEETRLGIPVTIHRSAQSLPGGSGRQHGRRRLLAVARDPGACSHRRPGSGAPVRRHGAP